MSKRQIKIILVSVIGLFTAITVILYSSAWLWPELWGSYKLGKKLYLLSWDNNTSIIVYGTAVIGNTCHGGSYVIPSDTIGLTGEYVLDAVPFSNHIIVMSNLYTLNEKKYYLISKDYEKADTISVDIIKNHIQPYADFILFSNTCDSLGISIPSSWKE
jgi:hypothetical protein